MQTRNDPKITDLDEIFYHQLLDVQLDFIKQGKFDKNIFVDLFKYSPKDNFIYKIRFLQFVGFLSKSKANDFFIKIFPQLTKLLTKSTQLISLIILIVSVRNQIQSSLILAFYESVMVQAIDSYFNKPKAKEKNQNFIREISNVQMTKDEIFYIIEIIASSKINYLTYRSEFIAIYYCLCDIHDNSFFPDFLVVPKLSSDDISKLNEFFVKKKNNTANQKSTRVHKQEEPMIDFSVVVNSKEFVEKYKSFAQKYKITLEKSTFLGSNYDNNDGLNSDNSLFASKLPKLFSATSSPSKTDQINPLKRNSYNIGENTRKTFLSSSQPVDTTSNNLNGPSSINNSTANMFHLNNKYMNFSEFPEYDFWLFHQNDINEITDDVSIKFHGAACLAHAQKKNDFAFNIKDISLKIVFDEELQFLVNEIKKLYKNDLINVLNYKTKSSILKNFVNLVVYFMYNERIFSIIESSMSSKCVLVLIYMASYFGKEISNNISTYVILQYQQMNQFIHSDEFFYHIYLHFIFTKCFSLNFETNKSIKPTTFLASSIYFSIYGIIDRLSFDWFHSASNSAENKNNHILLNSFVYQSFIKINLLKDLKILDKPTKTVDSVLPSAVTPSCTSRYGFRNMPRKVYIETYIIDENKMNCDFYVNLLKKYIKEDDKELFLIFSKYLFEQIMTSSTLKQNAFQIFLLYNKNYEPEQTNQMQQIILKYPTLLCQLQPPMKYGRFYGSLIRNLSFDRRLILFKDSIHPSQELFNATKAIIPNSAYIQSNIKEDTQLLSKMMHIKVNKKNILEINYDFENIFKKNSYSIDFATTSTICRKIEGNGANKEWHSLLWEEIKENSFIPATPTNSINKENKNVRNYLIFSNDPKYSLVKVGNFVAGSIYTNQLIDATFPKHVLKAIVTGRGPTLEDMKIFDPEKYDFLKKIKNSTKLKDDNILALTFQFNGKELIENGKNIHLTKENKSKYVDLVVKEYLQEEKIKEFAEGFYQIISQNSIALFTEQELQYLLRGEEKINIEKWKKSTKAKNEKLLNDFFNVIENLDEDMKKKILWFSTGSKLIPNEQFEFHLNDVSSDQQHPNAFINTNNLLLPHYTNLNDLKTILCSIVIS